MDEAADAGRPARCRAGGRRLFAVAWHSGIDVAGRSRGRPAGCPARRGGRCADPCFPGRPCERQCAHGQGGRLPDRREDQSPFGFLRRGLQGGGVDGGHARSFAQAGHGARATRHGAGPAETLHRTGLADGAPDATGAQPAPARPADPGYFHPPGLLSVRPQRDRHQRAGHDRWGPAAGCRHRARIQRGLLGPAACLPHRHGDGGRSGGGSAGRRRRPGHLGRPERQRRRGHAGRRHRPAGCLPAA